MDRLALTFQPKRQWRPKKRDRDPVKRRLRQQWYRKNKGKLKIKRNRRYQQLRNNPTYQRWQAKKRLEKNKRKFRMASESPLDLPDDGIPDVQPDPSGLPDIWFVFSEKPETLDVDMGYVVKYDPDEESFLIYDVDDFEFKVVGLDDFIQHVEFIEPEDWDNFLALMDEVYEGDIDMSDLAQRVASKYLEATHSKVGFNKHNPTELLNQMVKVLEAEASKTEDEDRKKALKDVASRVKGLAKPIQSAWEK